jgi:hypothetical protein
METHMNIFQETIRTAHVLSPMLGFMRAIDTAIVLKGCSPLEFADYIEANPGCTSICPLPNS